MRLIRLRSSSAGRGTMGLNLTAYPKIIFIQATEPTNKTVGLIWVDTDDGQTYVSDGSTYNALGATATGYIIDDTLYGISDDTEETAPTTAYTKIKEITLGIPDGATTLRIKFDGKAASFNDGWAAIYKNGGLVGTPRQFTASYATYSEDLEFTDGDTLELWAKKDTATTDVKNFRVYGYGVIDPNISGAVA